MDAEESPPPAEFGPAALDEFDAPAEVDAAFRTQRRVAAAYFLIFVAVLLSPPSLALVLEWWAEGRLFGGMTPGFAFVGIGLYIFFFLMSVAAATLANAVEDRMLGGREWDAQAEEERG
ncbi:MAG: hypothetical protein GEU74_14790 [Nitriliruptorales bacterium]|nr:hypothetical protein [Nitriliruptorales bacterium]